ncbi:MAG: hypothetical protein VB012_01560 [Erysipelotrichaceae bacterium]|nr:hypothetical protein [Erysipelotrichaceae bacterium]
MGFTKIKYMPYLNFYLDNINTSYNEVHLIYWNRDLRQENTSNLKNVLLHEFRLYQEDDVPKLSKLRSFYKYREFVFRILKQEEVDFIFVLHSLTGLLVIDKLQDRYYQKYIFDYRDSTYEKNALFKKAVGKLVHGSYATFVSSDAFRCFLPADENKKIFTSHNLLVNDLSHQNEREKYGIRSDKIRMAFWGFIRNEKINLELIKKVSRDNRFELHYYGREQKVALNLKQYVTQYSIQNVFFHGEYQPDDRYLFARKTDLIHNVYDDANMMLAMGNKYYDGIIFGVPQIGMKGSFMAELLKKNQIGIAINPYDDDCFNNIFDYYMTLDLSAFKRNCSVELNRVLNQYNTGIEFVKNTVERKG